METIRAAGYVRVSSKEQVDGESLTTQRKSITDFAKQHGYDLTEIYADEGISGGSVKDRHALLQCLYDGQQGKFNIIIIHRLSRFGRNARELLENHEQLSQAGIELRSISEGIDFSTKYGKAMLGMLSVIAELEKDIIREQMLENRIARGKRGVPTGGKLPYGRIYNKETGEWSLDENVIKWIRQASDDFLAGASLWEIADTSPMSYVNLLRTLKERCGDEWKIEFQDEEPITYKIPRILSETTITRIKDRLAFNRRSNRRDVVNKYVLSGFIRCDNCKNLLTGQTQTPTKQYYMHVGGKKSECKVFSSITLKSIEKAVFETIFENLIDVPNFERAIADSMPDEKMITELQLKIKDNEKEIKRINRELEKLVDLALSGTLSNETIHLKEQELISSKIKHQQSLENYNYKLNSLPDISSIKLEADTIRRQLLEKFTGQERLEEMTFEDKRALLHWLFEGKDHEGTAYGIYINKTGKGKASKIDYFIYGKIWGLRTLKGEDINYQEDEMEYKTINTGVKR